MNKFLKSDFKDKKYLFLFLPFFAILCISFVIGSFSVSGLSFFLLSVLFVVHVVNLKISSFLVFKYDSNIFLYLFNLFFSLGSFFKLTLFKKFSFIIREPFGFFDLNNNESIFRIIVLVCVASVAINLVLCFNVFIVRSNSTMKINHRTPLKKLQLFSIFFIALCSFLSFLNFRYNILMFGLSPSLNLPFHGNAIFYLLLTRVVPFFFLALCFNVKSYLSILYSSLLFLIVSLGVLSRMGIAIFALVLLLSIIRLYDFKKINFTKLITIVTSLLLVSLLTVGLSTSARNAFYTNQNATAKELPSPIENITNIFSKTLSVKSLEMFIDLTIARWIGLEAIMAVEAYPNKGMSLFLDALNEPAYKGDAFYNKILYNDNVIVKNKTISTSVPGPVAFFYYTGSKTAVFVFLTIFLLFFSFLEKILWKYYSDAFSAACFVIVFTTIDFHQFGIAPLSFFKYLLFTIVCLIIFYPIKKYLFREKNEQN